MQTMPEQVSLKSSEPLAQLTASQPEASCVAGGHKPRQSSMVCYTVLKGVTYVLDRAPQAIHSQFIH